ncbi:hypothetical protein K449DRAFT_140743 [Hypoxylon sp. EC38]|nr:hypothetical protein K449DRAFT_140743 [Hypoxylon sp. EC38]
MAFGSVNRVSLELLSLYYSRFSYIFPPSSSSRVTNWFDFTFLIHQTFHHTLLQKKWFIIRIYASNHEVDK